MAQLWKLPVIYIIENNQYAMGTAVKRAAAEVHFHRHGASMGIPGKQVDGMDVVAVREAGLEAVEHCRSGKGPIILEMKTYRYRGHSMSDPAKYRSKEEVNKMRAEHDPIDQVKRRLIDGKHADEAALKDIDREVKGVITEAAEFAQQSAEPDPSELYTDVLLAS
jgi:pyruvate dehydrogenase E1 component alpha subunit